MSQQLQRITEAKTAEEVDALLHLWNQATVAELAAARAADWERRAAKAKSWLAEVAK